MEFDVTTAVEEKPTQTVKFDPTTAKEITDSEQPAYTIQEAANTHAPEMAKYFTDPSTLGSVFNEEQKLAFDKLTAYTPNDNESQLRAINQAYVKTQMPNVPENIIDNNWDAVKKAYSDTRFGVSKDHVNDTEFHTNVSQTYKEIEDLKSPSKDPQPWDWKAKAAAIATITPFAVKSFWASINKSPVQDKLPTAPSNLPDKWYSLPGTTMTVNPAILAGVWNGGLKPFIENLYSPLGVATAYAAPVFEGLQAVKNVNPLAKTLLVSTQGTIALTSAYSTAELYPEQKNILDDPTKSLEERVAAGSKIAVPALTALLTGWGAVLDFKSPAEQQALVKEIKDNPENTVQILKREEEATDVPGEANAIRDVRQKLEEASKTIPTTPQENVAKTAELPTEEAPVIPEEAKPLAPEEQVIAKEAEKEPTVVGPEPTTIIEEGEGDTISIKNEVMDKEIESLGLKPTTSGEKKTFKDTVNEVNKKFKADPSIGQALVDELTTNPKAPTAEENVLLGLEARRLKNARKAAEESLIKARAEGNTEAEQSIQRQLDILRDQFAKTAETDKLVGKASGQSLAFRKVMLREDYSLASLERKLEVAKGGKLTPSELNDLRDISKQIEVSQQRVKSAEAKQRAQVKRYKTMGEKLTAKMEAGDFTREQRKATELSPEVAQARADYNKIKREFDRKVYEAEQARRTPIEKAKDFAIKWRRAGVLSRASIILKLSALVAERAITAPVRQFIGFVEQKGLEAAFPGLKGKGKFESIDTFGGYVRSEAKPITAMLTKGLRGSLDILRGKPTELEAQLDKIPLPTGLLDYAGNVHKALHYPIQVNDYVRRLQLLTERDLRLNPNQALDPLNQLKNMNEAFEYSQRAIYTNDNRIVSAYNAGLKILETTPKGKAGSTAAKLIAGTLRIENTVIKVPTNLALDITDHILGLPLGLGKLAVEAIKSSGGFEGLSYAETDQILRHLKNGSLGGALATYGFFKYKELGGFYERGEKRKKGELKPGEVKVGGVTIPSLAAKDVAFEVMQAGAQLNRTLHQTYGLKSGEKKTIPDGILAAAMGVADIVPFITDSSVIAKLQDPNQRGRVLASQLADYVEPGLVQEVAKQFDKPTPFDPFEDSVQRKGKAKSFGKTFIEELQLRTPGLRFKVPKAGSQDIKTFAR